MNEQADHDLGEERSGFSEGSGAAAEPPPPAKPGGASPLRIVLFALLAVAVVLLFIDRRGRMAAEAAMHDITALMPEDPSEIMDDAVTEEKVQEVVGRSPDDTYDGPSGRLVEEYRWQGLFNRQYIVYVTYQKGVINLLHSVTLNDKSDL